MGKLKIFICLLVVVLGYIVYLVKHPTTLKTLCDVEHVPKCFGKDICDDFYENKLVAEYKSFSDFFYNIISVKNVFFAKYEGLSVVVKQLLLSEHEDNINLVVSVDNIVLSDFKVCTNQTYKKLLHEFEKYEVVKGVSLNKFSVEPILLMLFQSQNNWPVPYYYGCCGNLFVEENSGYPLNDFQDFSWIDRAYIAKQILEAAFKFTFGHDKYRLYLTDISPDNIAVNKDFLITFVDLENGILTENYNDGTVHRSKYFPGETSYVFSEQDVCSSALSDHNVYSVCKLLLSREAPWPMMKGGLLHSPPPQLVEKYKTFFMDIERCVITNTEDRFDIGLRIIHILSEMLNKSVYS